MSILFTHLEKSCHLFELQIEKYPSIVISPDNILKALAKISKRDADKGIFIFTDSNYLSNEMDNLLSKGIWFSVLSELDDKENFEPSEFREMFLDWGFELQ